MRIDFMMILNDSLSRTDTRILGGGYLRVKSGLLEAHSYMSRVLMPSGASTVSGRSPRPMMPPVRCVGHYQYVVYYTLQ
jgi:hypothetical protein